MKHIYPLIFLLFFTSMAMAQAGQFDPSFGNNGIQKTNIGTGEPYSINAQYVLAGKDNKIYVLIAADNQTVVARYLNNGSIDSTYGTNGFSTPISFPLARYDNNSIHMAMQGDGKILLTGVSNIPGRSTDWDFTLIRFNTNGSLDRSFGIDGIQVTDMGDDQEFDSNEEIFSIAVGNDGKIVVGGHNGSNAAWHFALARYNPDGSLDSSFGTNGKVITAFTDSYSDHIYGIAIQSDGKILAAGDEKFIRYNKNGTVDSMFNVIKRVIYFDRSTSIVVQNGGKIIVASPSDFSYKVAHFNADGGLDSTFNGTGIATVPVHSSLYRSKLMVQNDGKITVSDDGLFTRYNSNGSIDSSFGDNGMLLLQDFSDKFWVAMQNDGKFIALQLVQTGSRYNFPPQYPSDKITYTSFLYRYNNNGMPDPTFSGDGKVKIDSPVPHNKLVTRFNGLAIQSDGKPVAGGYTLNSDSTYEDFAIARYNKNGLLDASFGNGGTQTTAVSKYVDYGTAIVIQPDGKIVAAGNSSEDSLSTPGATLVRYNSDGTLDAAFNKNVQQIKQIGRYQFRKLDIRTMALQSDGKIVVGGILDVFTGDDTSDFTRFGLARINTDGTLDSSFGPNGGIIYQYFISPWSYLKSLAIDKNGTIMAVGNVDDRFYFGLASFNKDGSVNQSFGDGGKLLISLPIAPSFVTFQNDGRFIVGGKNSNNGNPVIVRFNPDGSIDSSFNNQGTQPGIALPFAPNKNGNINSIAVQKNGKIIAGGSIFINAQSALSVARLNTNGTIDSTFGTNGVSVNQISPNSTDEITSIAISGNRLYAAGYSINQLTDTTSGIIAAYLLDSVNTGQPPVVIAPPTVKLCYDSSNRYTIDTLKATAVNGIQSIRYAVAGSISRSGTGPDASGLFGNGTSTITWTVKDMQGLTGTAQTIVIINPSMRLSIPGVKVLSKGVDSNTVYVGYTPASSLTLTAWANGGTPPYNYHWTTGVSSQAIKVAPTVAATYTVSATDALGCQLTASRQVKVMDVRCGENNDKVTVCQLPDLQTLCTEASAIPALLNSGGHLGACTLSDAAAIADSLLKKNGVECLFVQAFPNPSATYFTIGILSCDLKNSVYLKVMDGMGQVVETRTVSPNGLLQIGSAYRPGIYFMQVVQGMRIRMIKLIKQGQ